MKIFRKASHYAGGANRLSKTTSLLEKNASMETVNKVGGAEVTPGLPTKSEEAESSAHYYPQTDEKASIMAKYLHQQVISLFAAPFAALAKGLLIMDEKALERLFPVCWELLLVDDEEVTSITGTVCVVCAVKISKFVTDFIGKEVSTYVFNRTMAEQRKTYVKDEELSVLSRPPGKKLITSNRTNTLHPNHYQQ